MAPDATIDGTLKNLRTIHGVMLFSMILYVFIAERLIPPEPRNLNGTLPAAFGILCVAIVGLAMFFRTRKIRPAFETLQSEPNNMNALRQWRAGGILTAVLLEAVVLYGFALRFLGASLKVSLPFYVVGIALMALWWPLRP